MNNKPIAVKFEEEYFLFLLPLFFFLHGFTENYHMVNEADTALLILLYSLADMALCLALTFLFRSWRKAAVLVAALAGFNFFFGPLHDFIKQALDPSPLVKYAFLLPLVLLAFVALFIFLLRTKRRFALLTRYLNIVLLVFIVIDGFQLLNKIGKSKKDNAIPVGFTACDSCSRPDIYFIIADEYAGRQELQDIFHYDNSVFENQLMERGFHIIQNSKANYNYTPFCMASIFSMDFLQGIEGRNQSKEDRKICYPLINRNPVTRFLGSMGYEIKNFSVFQFNDDLPLEHSSFFLTGKGILTAPTFFSRLNRDLRFQLVTKFRMKSEMERLVQKDLNSTESLFNRTKEEALRKSDKPRFVYTHLMMPHYPYFFDSSGRRNPVETLMEGEQVRQDQYIGYLRYANRKFIELIDHILQHAKRPPVIVFMSDHGFRHFNGDEDHRYYFMNFDAVYMPGKNYGVFYDGMSTVNQFRALFNGQFAQHLPMLKDSTIFLQE